MRSQTFILLATAFLVCINISTARNKLAVAESPLQDRSNQRFLKFDNGDERAFEKAVGLINNLADAAKLKTYKNQLSQLKLGDNIVTILKSPQVEKFSTFNRNRDPAKQISLVGKISAKFGDGDLARTLVYLQSISDKDPKFLAVLKQLREEQVTEWVKKDKTIPQVIILLKIFNDDTLFRSKALDVLEDFIKKFNAAKGGDESLIKTLTTLCGGEDQLVTRIAKSKNDPLSIEKAKEVETQLFRKWDGEKLPYPAVWNRLKFEDDIIEALTSGKVTVFADYTSGRGNVLERLNANYGEANVAAALATALGYRETHDIAYALQREQLNGWLKKETSAGKVFGFLKFKESDGLTYKLDTLDKYVKLLKTKNPQDDTTVMAVLRKGFDGDEDQFRLMLKKMMQKVQNL